MTLIYVYDAAEQSINSFVDHPGISPVIGAGASRPDFFSCYEKSWVCEDMDVPDACRYDSPNACKETSDSYRRAKRFCWPGYEDGDDDDDDQPFR